MLRAFEAAGRTGSFRSAAQELNLTPSAVSHAIRKLEETLGVKLFERSARKIQPTPEGEALLHHISRGFEEIRHGLEMVSTRGPSLLRLHCAPSFAAQWLSPRLAGFFAEHPQIEVRLAASTEYARFETHEFDADIVYGRPKQGGVVALPLGEELVTPLCTPEVAATISQPADLRQHPLIQSDNKQIRWPAWFEANGLPSPPMHGARFDRSFLAIAAAVDGLGIALESTRLAERELNSGRLVRPLAGRERELRYVGHYLVFSAANQHQRTIRVFMEWLVRELGLKD
jgi:DNA-binding transcriptional LysR family regulator